MSKVSKIATQINPHGGINFVIAELERKGLPQLIDHKLGKRPKQAKYSFSSVIMGLIYGNFCGGKRLEDGRILKRQFGLHPTAKFCSPDTVGRVLKSLAVPTTCIPNSYTVNLDISPKFSHEKIKADAINAHKEPADLKITKAVEDQDNQINIHTAFNELLVDISCNLKLLVPGQNYILDYDTIVIPVEKKDSRYSYKCCRAYNPGVCFINSIPVYIEGRNGNSSPALKIRDAINMALTILKSHNITVTTVRMDAASYQKELIADLESKGLQYFIRAGKVKSLYRKLDETKWQKGKNGSRDCELMDVIGKLSGTHQPTRFVISRMAFYNKKNASGFADDLTLRTIITNNYSLTANEVIATYNKRGSMEREFDDLLNQFNWKRLPFSYLNQNVVYMIIQAIAKVIYQYVILKFSKKVKELQPTYRLKKFITYFISIPVSWIRTIDDDWEIVMYSDRDYSGFTL